MKKPAHYNQHVFVVIDTQSYEDFNIIAVKTTLCKAINHFNKHRTKEWNSAVDKDDLARFAKGIWGPNIFKHKVE